MTITRTNEKIDIIDEFFDVELNVNYFWDNHGNLIDLTDNSEEPTHWSKADIQICKYSFTENLLGGALDFEYLQLVVNDRVICGDITSYTVKTISNNTTVHCNITVGWG